MKSNYQRFGVAIAVATVLASGASRGAWRSRTPLPEGVSGGVAAALQGKLIYAGGTTWRDGKKIWLSSVRVFDPALNTWSSGAELGEGLAYGPALQSSRGLEIFGGLTSTGASKTVWRLAHAGAEHWEKAGTLGFSTGLGSAAEIAGRTFIFGGCSDAGNLSSCSAAVMMRREDGSWTESGKLPGGPFALAASAVVRGRVYLFGGCRVSGPGTIVNLNSAWRYSPATGEWRALRPAPVAARGMAAVALQSGSILLAGGYDAPADQAQRHGPEYGFSAAVWLYHPDRDSYEPMTPLPHGIMGLSLARDRDAVFGAGGEDRVRGRSSALLEALIR